MFGEEKWQSLQNQGLDLLGFLVPMSLLHSVIFLLNEVTEPFATKGLVESCGFQS